MTRSGLRLACIACSCLIDWVATEALSEPSDSYSLNMSALLLACIDYFKSASRICRSSISRLVLLCRFSVSMQRIGCVSLYDVLSKGRRPRLYPVALLRVWLEGSKIGGAPKRLDESVSWLA